MLTFVQKYGLLGVLSNYSIYSRSASIRNESLLWYQQHAAFHT